MPKSESLDEALARLATVRREPYTAEARRQLADALQSGPSPVVAKAAQIAAEAQHSSLGPDLAAAFDRFMVNPLASDKACAAKIGIVAALTKLDAFADAVFLSAVRHVQLEPSYGGPIDTAAPLRAMAAIALAEARHPQALECAAVLLADKEPEARIGAVRALVAASSEASALLLRFKALIGDQDRGVLSECFAALLTISHGSLGFVASFLQHDDAETAGVAAVALGQSRLPGTFRLLCDAWETRLDRGFRNLALLGIGMLRDEESLAFLIRLVEEAAPAVAAEALQSLAPYRHDNAVRTKVAAAVTANGTALVRDAFVAAYGPR